MGYKGPSFPYVRVTNFKKELAFTKDSMKDPFINGTKMNVQLCQMDGLIGRKGLW